MLGAVIGGIEYLRYESGEREFYVVDREPTRLAMTILEQLRSDVEHQGAALLVPILIPIWDFHYVKEGRAFPYEGLLEILEQKFDTIETFSRLFHHAKNGNVHELFSQLHYSAKANEMIGEIIATAVSARASGTLK